MESIPNPKIFRLNEFPRIRSKGLVLAHGCFDLLHIGHLLHLQEAREQGRVLAVSITPDEFVNKGPGRPYFPLMIRAEMMAALEIVNIVILNEGPTAVPAILALEPAVYAKGPDWKGQMDKGERDAVKACGGRIYYTQAKKFSSTEIGQRILTA